MLWLVVALLGIYSAGYLLLGKWHSGVKRGIDHAFASFGGGVADDDERLVESQRRQILIPQYARQQSYAFGLVCLSTVMGVALAVAIILGVLFGVFEIGAYLAGGAGVVGEMWLWRRSYKLYREASDRLSSAPWDL